MTEHADPEAPTPLGVYLECLHLIEALPGHERIAVCGALHALSMVDRPILTDDVVDYREMVAGLRIEIQELKNVVTSAPPADGDE